MLSSPQRRLLKEANVSISWATPDGEQKRKSFDIGNQFIIQAVKVLSDIPGYVDLSTKEALEKYNKKEFWWNQIEDLATVFAGVRSAGDIVLNSGIENSGFEEPSWWRYPPANLTPQQRIGWKQTPWKIDHPNNKMYPGLTQIVKNIESLGHSVAIRSVGEYKNGIFVAHKDSGLTGDDVLKMRPVERGIAYGYPPDDVRAWAKHHKLD